MTIAGTSKCPRARARPPVWQPRGDDMDRCRSGLRGAGLSRGENDRAGLRYAPISHDRSADAMERKAQRSPSHAPRDLEEQPVAERNARRPEYEGINAVGHRNNSCALIRAAHETPA